jgi:Uma2 family endonuclease
MVQRLPTGYRFDPDDPRAPSEAEWEQMSPEERSRVVAMLPEQPVLSTEPPEGDTHSKTASITRFTLDSFFRRTGRKIYVSSNLAVYYPNERCFAPDVLAVRDVEQHDREKWIVAEEGKGLDLAIEVHVRGNRKKDAVDNVELYARLGIEEYFFFDRSQLLLRGYRLPPPGPRRLRQPHAYVPIVPQEGRFSSEVLGLDLMLEGDKLRFLYGMAAVPEADELIAKLGTALGEAFQAKEDADAALRAAEAAKADAETAKDTAEAAKADAEAAKADAERRASALEQELAEARAEIERLRQRR